MVASSLRLVPVWVFRLQSITISRFITCFVSFIRYKQDLKAKAKETAESWAPSCANDPPQWTERETTHRAPSCPLWSSPPPPSPSLIVCLHSNHAITATLPHQACRPCWKRALSVLSFWISSGCKQNKTNKKKTKTRGHFFNCAQHTLKKRRIVVINAQVLLVQQDVWLYFFFSFFKFKLYLVR